MSVLRFSLVALYEDVMAENESIIHHYSILATMEDGTEHWLKQGAQPSDSVRTLIARHLTVKPAAEPAAQAK